MKINEAWHARNPMSERPTLEERIKWHLSHARHCACRPIPAKVAQAIRARGLSARGRR